MKLINTIKLNKGKGRLIANASDVFNGYIDSDFKNLGERTATVPKPRTFEVKELTENSTFKQMFNVDTDVLTQEEIVLFCQNHKEELNQNGYATLFLFKENDDFFVARVFVDDDGQLYVLVDPLEDDYVWYARFQHRLVVPQILLSSEIKSLESSETLSLEFAIKLLKEHGYKISKDY